MFIIFDEFSKFIESSGSSLMKNLKIIQDFAELASRSSKNCQLHITCVTHKSLNLYIDSSNKKDSFKTVEGRFSEIKFNRSLEENYQIISAAIRKKDGYEKALSGFKKKDAGFIERIQKSQPFEKEGNVDSLINGCFPLNPMTVYALIHLSEIVAQNERTLFTFISDTDEHSLNSFIRNSSTASKLFDVDEIYDYFVDNFQGDSLLAVGDEELIKIHYHTNEPWKVLEYCASLGEIYDIVVEDMDRQSRGLKG